MADPSGLVLDSGVFVRWYVEQEGFEHARRLRAQFLAGEMTLLTTDLARVEVANVLRKKGLLPGLLSRDDYLQATTDIDALGVRVEVTTTDVLTRAAALAADRSVTVFDALFVGLALSTGLPLVTADKKLASTAAAIVSTVLLHGVPSDAPSP